MRSTSVIESPTDIQRAALAAVAGALPSLLAVADRGAYVSQRGTEHDIANLMTAVVVPIRILRETTPRGDPREESIRGVCSRATRMARRLRGRAKMGTLPPSPQNIDEVISDMVILGRAMIGGDVALHVDHRARAVRVRADRADLDRVLFNLLLNARQAVSGDGRIALFTRRAAGPPRIEGVGPGRGILLSVMDDGCGMDEETLRVAFLPGCTTRVAEGGSGLGLAIVRSVATALGGWVDVESHPGKGTRVDVWLPVVP